MLSTPPDDILSDPSLDQRTFALSQRRGFRAAVTYGRLARFHALVLPGVQREYAESIGNLINLSWTQADFAQLLQVIFHAQCAAAERRDVQPVRFEHGNGALWAAARYGTHVAHMHCLFTAQPDVFRDKLLEQFKESESDRRWLPVSGWHDIQGLAESKREYLFFQVGQDAWACELSKPSNLPHQFLRQIAYPCFQATKESVSNHWLWRSANDGVQAIEDAELLRDLVPSEGLVEAALRTTA